MTTYKTLENKIIADGEKLPDEFLMIDENGKATWADFRGDTATFSPVSADILAIIEGTPVQPEKPAVTYIAMANDYYGKFSVKILASNAHSSEHVGIYKTIEECQEAVKRFGQVTWVTPYRFQKEVSCY